MAENTDIPAYCVLAHRNLEDIQKMLMENNTQVRNLSHQLVSADGYIPRIHERLSIVELSAERAHSRLDSHAGYIEEANKSHNVLALKVGTIVAGLSGVIFFLIDMLRSSGG